MNVLTLTRYFMIMFIVVILASCSSAGKVAIPDNSSLDGSLSDEPHFQITLDQNTGDVELIERDVAWDMTGCFIIRLRKYSWDPALKLLYATVDVESIVDTPLWGVRMVFDNTGGRWLVNSDGYAYYNHGPNTPPAKRMPFISYERDSYHRIMTSMDSRELIVYCPAGATTFNFWIDAIRPWEREEPIVEEQFCRKTLAISAWAVTAFCYDYQSHYQRTPRGGINDLRVWADLSKVGGASEVPMYDDGSHFDYEEGDYIFGIGFVPNPSVNFGMITIYCEDSDGNISENDVAFIRHYTLREYDIETIDKGLWSELEGPHYEIIRNSSRWEEFWEIHKGAPIPAPAVNFDKDMVLVAIWGFAGGGQWLEINKAFENTKRKLQIELSTWNGSKGCILPTLLTNAYHIAKIPICNLIPDPKFRSKIFYCDEQVNMTIVEQGQFSLIHDYRRLLITDFATFETMWNEHTGGGTPPPQIDFDEYTVAAVFMGDQQYDDTYVAIDRLMDYQAYMREIYYSEHFPGNGCELVPLDCQPYVIVMFSKDEMDSYDFYGRIVMDDCV